MFCIRIYAGDLRHQPRCLRRGLHAEVTASVSILLSAFEAGMPGGPRMSMPYSAAMAVICSGWGSPGGGRVSAWAGSARARVKASKPAGSVTSKKRASPSELIVKVCGVSWGTEDEGSGWCPDHLAVGPDGQLAFRDVEPLVLAVVHMQRRACVFGGEVLDDRDAACRPSVEALMVARGAHETRAPRLRRVATRWGSARGCDW